MDRQKMMLIFVGAWISAGLLVWLLYSSTKAPRVEKTVAILAAARDMSAGTLLKKADLKTIRVPETDVPKMAIRDSNQALDHPLLYPVNANEPITLYRIGSTTGVDGLAASIEPGKRAIAVPITDSSGVAGLIQPRSHVDVLFTRAGQNADAVTTTVLEDVIVLAMGRNTESTSAAAAAATQTIGQATRAAQSATLLVTPEQARRVELAKNQGKISLALRNPLDKTVDNGNATTARELYPFPEKAVVKPAVVEKPPIAEKKEPPKPKAIVEVYRGEKHVQEVFP